jgi:hypothetical protein
LKKGTPHIVHKQAIAFTLLLTLLAWSLADETPVSVAHQQAKLLKHAPEWVGFQLGFSKESYTNSIEKDFTLILSHPSNNITLASTSTLSQDALLVNNYQRNPFYELTFIHAP